MANADNKDCNEFIIYIVKQDIRIYMLPIAGQTAGPIGLNFFVDTHGWPGGFFKFFFLSIFFPWANL